MKPGKTADAQSRYDEALKFAPNWQQLVAARGVAGKQKSRLRLSPNGDDTRLYSS
jgi:hypothetical protein